MDVVAEGLRVGTAADATDDSLLETHGVTTIVSLTHETPNPAAQDLTLRSIPLIDGPQNSREQFTKAVEETVAALAADESVLVHCSAGASRSPTVAATALALAQNHGSCGCRSTGSRQQGCRRSPRSTTPAGGPRVYATQLQVLSD